MWQMWCTLLIKWCTLLIKHLVCWAIVPLFTANKTQGKRCKHEFNAHAGGIVRQRKCAVCVCVCVCARALARLSNDAYRHRRERQHTIIVAAKSFLLGRASNTASCSRRSGVHS